MKKVTLNAKEQQRVKVIHEVGSGMLTGRQGSELLGVTVRQVRRMVQRYRLEGVAGLAHRNRGRASARKIGAGVRAEVVRLARERYPGCNYSHLAEVLAEREGLHLSRSSVRRVLLGAGMGSPRRRRPPQHRARRERYPQEGMLLQVDGSHHAWLEERGPRFVLLGAVDDATGTVPGALFWETEDHWGYLHLLQQIVEAKGIPLALYTDRHGVFQHNPPQEETREEQLAGRREPTQVGRILEELGISLILARSPQAKGRVERLWGTFQDRLVAELRWAGATTLAEANVVLAAFLPRFNARFGVKPAQVGTAYRPWAQEGCPEHVFCLKERRVVALDNTVRWRGHVWQLLPSQARKSYAKAKVDVCERLDGSIAVMYQGIAIPMTQAPPRATPPPATSSPRASTAHPPPPDHPWRRTRTFSKNT